MTEMRWRVEDVPGITRSKRDGMGDVRVGREFGLGEREEEEKKWKDRDRIRVARLGNAPCVSLSPGISFPTSHVSMYPRRISIFFMFVITI
jgi:hypothetical protein